MNHQVEDSGLPNSEISANLVMGATAIGIPILFSLSLLIFPDNRESLELAIPVAAVGVAYVLGFVSRNIVPNSWRTSLNVGSVLIVGWQLSIVGQGKFPYSLEWIWISRCSFDNCTCGHLCGCSKTND